MNIRWLAPACIVLALAACSSAPKKAPPTAGSGTSAKGVKVQGKGPAHVATGCPGTALYPAAKEDPSTRGDYTAGGLYKPGVKDSTPTEIPNVACIPEPLVSNEAYSPIGNKSPYEVLGKKYKVRDDAKGYKERGTASYYGSKFHGRLTSNREVYDMYAFTAAHKTLPLPSFALVTNVDTGDSVVVRVNDRGPFHDGRVIDLSYAAAVKLGITQRGTGNVEVRGLTEDDNAMLLARRGTGNGRSAAPTTAVAAAAPARNASDIDKLVQRLPPASTPAKATPAAGSAAAPVATGGTAAVAAAAASTSANAGERWRYRVADAKQPGNADNFDAWMKAQGVRVASGKPTPVASASAAGTSSAAPAPAPVAAAKVEPAREPEPTLAQSALGDILLQVASFASRDNANRALAQLAAAGIAGATVSDIVSGGRTLWRLRVNANDHASAAELAGRIAGLGFGKPQIVSQ